ncbi:MAG: SH3 domain-containing protein [Defluviitaleaceae bacterium]|nr:SH3 domain-containing protein [Defluviitaleaceae bacterium]
MTIIRTTFDWAGELYGRIFADWLHIHFLIRTVLILFVMLLGVFLLAQFVKYVAAPIILMIFYHVFFRAWNYLFVETPHEWIYIKYHSQDRPNFAKTYLRLCDKVKRNRMILSHTKYKGIVIRSRRFSMQFMVVLAVTVTLWASAFGLHFQYATPVVAIVNEPEIEYIPAEEEYIPEEIIVFAEEVFLPEYFAENSVLALNEQGSQGARLRDGPGITDSTIIEIVWDDDELIFLNEYEPDVYVNGMFWLLVQSPSGTIGYISSQLIE